MRLEIGNYIYSDGWGIRRYQITRVSDKTAWAGNIRLPREIDDRFSTKEIGGSTYFYAETPELKARYHKQYLLNNMYHKQYLLNNIQHFVRNNIENLSIGQLEQISEIIKEAV